MIIQPASHEVTKLPTSKTIASELDRTPSFSLRDALEPPKSVDLGYTLYDSEGQWVEAGVEGSGYRSGGADTHRLEIYRRGADGRVTGPSNRFYADEDVEALMAIRKTHHHAQLQEFYELKQQYHLPVSKIDP